MPPFARILVTLFLVALPLAAQTFDEVPASDVARYGYASEVVVAAGSNGDGFLAVGRRRGALFAHRVTADGDVLDPAGIPLAPPVSGALGVFWAGDAYTILTQRDGVAYVTRMDTAGHIVAAARKVLDRSGSAAASNGKRIVIAGGTTSVLDMQGNVVADSVPLPVETTDGGSGFRIASNGSGFLVDWSELVGGAYHNDRVALDGDGKPTGSRMVDPSSFLLSLASDGFDYVGVVQDRSNFNVVARRISPSGQFMSYFHIPGLNFSDEAMIGWNGSSYVVSAVDTQPPQAPILVRLGPNADPIDAGPNRSPYQTAYAPLAMISNGQRLFMSWLGTIGSVGTSNGAIVRGDLTFVRQFALGYAAIEQDNPSIAASSAGLYVAWEENGAIYGSRFTLNGQRLGDGVRISNSLANSPRVIWDGQAWVAVWRTNSGPLSTTRIAPDGGLTPVVQKLVFSDCMNDPDLATDGSEAAFVVAASCSGPILATRLHRDSSSDFPIIVSHSTRTGSPRVAWNGSEFLVVWREWDANFSHSHLSAARVSPGMAVLDLQPLAIDAGNDTVGTPLVASDGHDFMVAWTINGGSDVRARSVSAGGVLGDAISFGPGTASSIAWTGRSFVLAYGKTYGRASVRFIGMDAILPVSVSTDETFAASLAITPSGALVAAYDRTASEPTYGGVPRVFVKSVTPVGRIRVVGR